MLFAIFEWIGTVAFAISGALEAIRHKMDLLGVAVLGLVTACGGGVIRDLVVGNIPPRMFQNPRFALVAMLTALGVFIVLKVSKKSVSQPSKLREMVYFVSDTLGLAAFTVLSIHSVPYRGFALLLFVGVITATGGGVLRDVLAGTVPSIFKKHIYALASAAGAVVDIALLRIVPPQTAMLVGFITVVVVRSLAYHFKWNLPRIED